MSRHSAPGTDGAYGDETWLPGGSSAEPADGATEPEAPAGPARG